MMHRPGGRPETSARERAERGEREGRGEKENYSQAMNWKMPEMVNLFPLLSMKS